jgi:hypothetical protein
MVVLLSRLFKQLATANNIFMPQLTGVVVKHSQLAGFKKQELVNNVFVFLGIKTRSKHQVN